MANFQYSIRVDIKLILPTGICGGGGGGIPPVPKSIIHGSLAVVMAIPTTRIYVATLSFVVFTLKNALDNNEYSDII